VTFGDVQRLGRLSNDAKGQKSTFVFTLAVAATLTGGTIGLFAAEKPSGSKDAAVERTRQEVKMLDDLFKNAIVLIDGHYVKTPPDLPAATAAKALWAALKGELPHVPREFQGKQGERRGAIPTRHP
jgi:hypothetical protein